MSHTIYAANGKEKSVTFTGACDNEIIPNGQLARLLAKRKMEVRLEYLI